MPRIRYDVSDVEETQFSHVKPGMYVCRVEEINYREDTGSGNGPNLEVVLKPVKDARGKRIRDPRTPSNVYTYILLDHDPSKWKLWEFLAAFGLPRRGSFDPDKLVGREVMANLKADRDLDDNYRPRVGKLMRAGAAESADEEGDDEGEEDADEEGEGEEEVSVEEAIAEHSRAELKAFIREHELEVRVLRKDSDDDIRAKIVDAWPDDEEGDEDEEGDDEGEEDADEEGEGEEEVSVEEAIAEHSRAELKAFIREHELEVRVLRKDSDDDIRAKIVDAWPDDEEGDEDEEGDDEGEEDADYSDWSLDQLKAELRQRGLRAEGRKPVLIKRLEKDDESAGDDEPF